MKDSYDVNSGDGGEREGGSPSPPPPPSSTEHRRSLTGVLNVGFADDELNYGTSDATGGREELSLQRADVKPKKVTQMIGTFAAALAHLGIGTIIGFSGVTIPQLTDQESPNFSLTEFQATLFSSVIHLGACLGCVVGGVPHAFIGHRWSLLVALPGSLVAWLVLFFSRVPWLLIFARGFMGFTMGVTCLSASNYVKEFAHKDLKPSLLAALDALRQSGFLVVYALGYKGHLSWRYIAIICGTLTTVVPFVFFLFLPNAPRWLILRGRMDEAERSLQFYRGRDYDSHGELMKIRHKLERRRDSVTMTDQLRNMRDPVLLRFVVIFAILHFVSQFTGEVVISAYIVPLFQLAHASFPYSDAIIVGAMRVLATLVYFLEVQRVGRKRLVISSFLICGLSLGILAISFYDQNRDEIFSDYEVIPIVTIAIFSFFSNIGFPVLNLVDVELLPDTAKATGLAILYGTYYFGGFIATLTYPTMIASIGPSSTFWVYCVFNIIVVVIDYADLPETRGKTAEEIITKEREDDISKKGALPSY
ncbi:facilitated trehalose transporter Tret1-like [Penaeus japonicus]|uniref:facilitated trehalose transporter Tret1-like n=1 Tax=Penaeus japonicus TaxID=27405 RepID=UPI001C715DBD|nr:facilitated trehalose transporter Tret1-like [Penaeus japonicus]XP_042892760.1 facilitated trehalose transporter Tret1-like [Penaeus japonicus]XP_042892761.1 facilitated trehalose transporter Tret1-like [Penaeus japonicus]